MSKMPAIYLSHGAPPLLEDATWGSELAHWSADLPTPKAILIVSAHWESAPLTVGATDPNVGLIYDFGGFAPKYYNLEYRAPGAADLAARLSAMMGEPVVQQPNRGLDHGAYIPLMKMYPGANIPVLQMSIPTHDPQKLFDLGKKLAPLRDEGVLIVGSGFLTHGLPFLTEFRIDATPPGWSKEFDLWAAETLSRGAIDDLMNYKTLAPGMPYAHPTVEHFAPIFITLGAATNAEVAPDTAIEGYWMGLSKRSFQVA